MLRRDYDYAIVILSLNNLVSVEILNLDKATLFSNNVMRILMRNVIVSNLSVQYSTSPNLTSADIYGNAKIYRYYLNCLIVHSIFFYHEILRSR